MTLQRVLDTQDQFAQDIIEIKATMFDLENRERAIYEYIDRAISDSTHTRFDETNNRIAAIDSRLDTKLEEVMLAIRHIGQLSKGKKH